MKVGKPKSKRTPVRLRHKIQKASASKERKQRKEAKKNPQWRSRIKKDPGIPNLFPYKADVLAHLEERKRAKEEEQQRKREIARQQRHGVVHGIGLDAPKPLEEDEDGDARILEDDESDEEDIEMDMQSEINPMAVLLASAQARAQAHPHGEDDMRELEEDDGEEEEAWEGLEAGNKTASSAPSKSIPRQQLADPIKAVSALLERTERITNGIQQLVEHYHIPPIVAAGDDLTPRFLVEVARKRGRLGRGGLPNLHAAALVVLADFNEGKIPLTLDSSAPSGGRAGEISKGEVKIVQKMAEPFRLEGLYGNDPGGT